MLVNNEVGTIQPVGDFVAAAHAKASLLLCDAVQAYGRVAIPEGPDLIALSPHKIHGPKGIGALGGRDGFDTKPWVLCGATERWETGQGGEEGSHTGRIQGDKDLKTKKT